MNRFKIAALTVALAVSIIPCFARGHSSHAGGYGAGPNDTTRTHDYSRHIGRTNSPRLSTGWTHGHGSRTHETHDYYRHSRSGATSHVHGYYHRGR